MPPFPVPASPDSGGILIVAVFLIVAWGGALAGGRGGIALASTILLVMGLGMYALSRGAIHEISAAVFVVGSVLVAARRRASDVKSTEVFAPTSLYRGVPYRTEDNGIVIAIIDGEAMRFHNDGLMKRFVDDMLSHRQSWFN
jgi:hypothetical protein